MKTIPSSVLFFFRVRVANANAMLSSLSPLFGSARRRGVRCTARRLDVSGRKVDGGLEARRAVLPRARRKQEEGGAGGAKSTGTPPAAGPLEPWLRVNGSVPFLARKPGCFRMKRAPVAGRGPTLSQNCRLTEHSTGNIFT